MHVFHAHVDEATTPEDGDLVQSPQVDCTRHPHLSGQHGKVGVRQHPKLVSAQNLTEAGDAIGSLEAAEVPHIRRSFEHDASRDSVGVHHIVLKPHYSLPSGYLVLWIKLSLSEEAIPFPFNSPRATSNLFEAVRVSLNNP
jgi:hypothetical protein